MYKTQQHSTERSSGEPKNTGRAGPSGSHNANHQVAALDMDDFMDKEEERKATFKQVIQYSLPRMVTFLNAGKKKDRTYTVHQDMFLFLSFIEDIRGYLLNDSLPRQGTTSTQNG